MGNQAAGAGGAGERHHVDIRVFDQRVAHGVAFAADEIEDTLGKVCLGQNVRQDIGTLGRDFRRLEHYRATGGNGRNHLEDDLVQGVVPGSDASHHAHRRVLHLGVADLFGEGEFRQHFQVAFGNGRRQPRLDAGGQFNGHSHFPAHRFGYFTCPFFQAGMQLLQHMQSFFQRAFRPAFESRTGGGYGLLHFLTTGGGDPGNNVASGRFVDINGLTIPVLPLAVDVVFAEIFHGSAPE